MWGDDYNRCNESMDSKRGRCILVYIYLFVLFFFANLSCIPAILKIHVPRD